MVHAMPVSFIFLVDCAKSHLQATSKSELDLPAEYMNPQSKFDSVCVLQSDGWTDEINRWVVSMCDGWNAGNWATSACCAEVDKRIALCLRRLSAFNISVFCNSDSCYATAIAMPLYTLWSERFQCKLWSITHDDDHQIQCKLWSIGSDRASDYSPI